MTPFTRRRRFRPLLLQRQPPTVAGPTAVVSLLVGVLLLLFSALLLLPRILPVVVSADDTTNANQNCAMDIWIFSSFESCQASDAPVANGKLYADGQCRTIETDLSPSDPTYSLFPGNYRVQCMAAAAAATNASGSTANNMIRFSDSACLDNACSVTSLVAGTTVCDRDNASPASLYSRLEPPEYVVQDPANANVGAFYTCLKLNATDVTVTFVVFGDCSQCVVTATPAPVAPSTEPPTSLPPATAPPQPTTTTTTTTAPVSVVPTSMAPIVNVTNNNNSTTAPSAAPSNSPIVVTTVAPVATTVAPVVSPTATVPTATVPTKGLIHDFITVAIKLSPMNATIDATSDSIRRWEDVTIDQIRSVAESDVYNTIIYAIDISNITQKVIDLTGSQRRSLQETENVTTISIGTTKAMALQIMFVVYMSYSPSTTSTSTATTLTDLFTASFDSEQDRSNYLIKLVTNDDIFTSVRLVEVIYVNGTTPNNNTTPLPVAPVAAPTTDVTSNSDEKSNTGLLVALAGGGTALIVFAIFGIAFYQRQQNKFNSGSNNSKGKSTNEVETPSDNDECYGGTGPVGPLNFSNNHHHSDPNSPSSQQRWTNEIVVDPSADDVSTLGGSVLLGYLDPTTTNGNNNNNNTSNVEDEPTASVNLDFDYNNNQYRSDVEDRSRTVFTEATGPTTFTNFTSKLGMNGEAMFSDDASFDELYAEIDDTTNDKANDNKIAIDPLNLNPIANMVKPFEVRVPPGKLGMVVDTPNGGVPVVRAIRPDSVLHGSVLVGDRLISVDHKDVTNMTALDVSSLISLKKNQHRLMVFCRLQQQQSPPGPQIVTITAATTPQSSTLAQPSPVGTAMATASH